MYQVLQYKRFRMYKWLRTNDRPCHVIPDGRSTLSLQNAQWGGGGSVSQDLFLAL